MPATETNALKRAREAVANNEDCDVERLKVLINTIEDASEAGAALNKQREELREQALAKNKEVEVAYEELEKLIPANPLGNLNIGAVVASQSDDSRGG